jgi:hypothetical protein
VQPAQGGQVADLGRGQLRGRHEVEPLQGDLLLELRALEPPLEGDGLAAGDLVLAEDLQEVEVTELSFCAVAPTPWRRSSVPAHGSGIRC